MDDDKTVSAEEARGLLKHIGAGSLDVEVNTLSSTDLRNIRRTDLDYVIADEVAAPLAPLLAAAPDLARTVIALHAKLAKADADRYQAESERDALRARVEKLERRPSEAAVRHDAERCLLMLLWDAIDGEQDGDAPGNREMRDNLIARVREKVEAVEAERDEARETNKRLHRRVQQAEGDVASLRCLIPVGTPHRNDVVEFRRAYAVGAKVWGADGKPAFTGQSVRGGLWPLHEWVAHVVAERDEARRQRDRLQKEIEESAELLSGLGRQVEDLLAGVKRARIFGGGISAAADAAREGVADV